MFVCFYPTSENDSLRSKSFEIEFSSVKKIRKGKEAVNCLNGALLCFRDAHRRHRDDRMTVFETVSQDRGEYFQGGKRSPRISAKALFSAGS